MKKYNDLNTYFRNLFGCRVQKIAIDAGFSCPNRDGTLSTAGCIYCNQFGSGTGAYGKGFSITDQLIKGKRVLSKRYGAKKFMAYFQSFSNTYAPAFKLKGMYEEALAVDDIVGLSIGTRPDCVDEPVLELLQGYAKDYLIWIEYGLQTATDATLAFINRGHDVQCFKKTVAATKNRGINICAHVILGLPNEQRSHMLRTAEIVTDAGIDGVKLHVLYVIKGTKLEHLYRQGRYICLERRQYADLVCDFLERIPGHVVIQRLTSDPHPQEHVAPAWVLDKSETLSRIEATLDKRDSWQGKRCTPERYEDRAD